MGPIGAGALFEFIFQIPLGGFVPTWKVNLIIIVATTIRAPCVCSISKLDSLFSQNSLTFGFLPVFKMIEGVGFYSQLFYLISGNETSSFSTAINGCY